MTFAQRFAEAALERNGHYDDRMRAALWNAVDVNKLKIYAVDAGDYPVMPTVIARQAQKQSVTARSVVALTCNDPQLLDKLARKGLVKLRREVAANPACSAETVAYLWKLTEDKYDYKLQTALLSRYSRICANTPVSERGQLIVRFSEETDKSGHLEQVVQRVCRFTMDATDDIDEQVRQLAVLHRVTPRPHKFVVLSWMLANAPMTTEMVTTISQASALREHVDIPANGPRHAFEIPINARLVDQPAFISLLHRYPYLKDKLQAYSWDAKPLENWDADLIDIVLRDGRPNCVVRMLNNHPQVVATLTPDAVRLALARAGEMNTTWQSPRLTKFLLSYVSCHVNVTGDTYAAIVAMLEASTTDLLTTVRSLQLTFGKP